MTATGCGGGRNQLRIHASCAMLEISSNRKNLRRRRTAAASREGSRAMSLARLWREHLEAGCPSELQGVEIAGSDVVALDAEVTAYVSAVVTQTCLNTDERVSRRLEEIHEALAQTLVDAPAPVANYCARLNGLIGAALVRLRTR